MPQTTYIRRVAARALYSSESHMSRYVHGSGRDDEQLNNRPQSRFPKIPGLGAAGFSPPTVQQYRSYSILVREGNRHG